MNWRSLFREVTWEKGKTNFHEGGVQSICTKPNGYEGIVKDINPYRVRIYLRAGTVYDMTCTCMDAKGGDYCKHMAAFICALEYKKEELFYYKKRIDAAFDHKSELEAEISKIIFVDLQTTIEQRDFSVVFQTTSYLFHQWIRSRMEEEILYVIEKIFDIWNQLLKVELELELKSIFFYWMTQEVECVECTYINRRLLNILEENFQERCFYSQKIKLINRRIKEWKIEQVMWCEDGLS